VTAPHPFLPALLALFIGSGCAALIYEVVWFQLLQLSVGSSAVSLGIVLATFMGGTCLGSLLLPTFVSPHRHPLRVYALLELGIALCALFVLLAEPLIGAAYTTVGGSGRANVFFRAIVAGVCLLPPTLLMGATLPAISRWVHATPVGVSWLGYFYGGNLAGAVLGSLVGGFYLLRLFDVTTATLVAVAMNVTIALVALVLERSTPYVAAPLEEGGRAGAGSRLIYAAIGLSGLTALGAEVIWTRQLSLLFGATTYTFSLILAVFLTGLGIGSGIGSAMAHRAARPSVALACCQLFLCVTLSWAAYAIGASLPYWPINPSLSSAPLYNFQLDVVRALWVMLPSTVLWGASFPLALASAAVPGQDTGHLLGRLYAANTIGAIVGALATGLVLVGTMGSQPAQQAFIILTALSGVLVLYSAARAGDARPVLRLPIPVLAVGVFLAAAILASRVPALPGMLVAFGGYAATWMGTTEILYVGEGVTSTVAISRSSDGVLHYHSAGKVQASSKPEDMRLQRMLGHLTTLTHGDPARVLVIGCGAGVTAGAVAIDPRVKQLTIAEIEPLVPQAASAYFADYNFDVLHNPKVRLHFDDARHYLRTTNETFDAITSDPFDPWVRGAATLSTREFFGAIKEHLNPGGVVTLWVALYETTEEAVKSEVATFLDVFPDGAVFANTVNDEGYDLVLFAQRDGNRIDVEAAQARFGAPDMEPVRRSLGEVGIDSAIDLFATYAGSKADMAGWLRGAAINRDRNLRLQYLAGLGLNRYENASIYRNMIVGARYPERLFEGSTATRQALRAQITGALTRSRSAPVGGT
jgi:spermidine synthase